MRVLSYLPTVHTGQGPSYTAMSIAAALADLCDNFAFYTPWSTGARPDHLDVRAGCKLPLPYRLLARGPLLPAARQRIERQILADLDTAREETVLHIWPGADIAFARQAKRRGARLVREMINTHEGYAKRILDAESQRLGLPPQHTITDASVEREQAFLEECDTILSPSAIVDDSLAAYGFGDERVCRVSFGWDPARFAARQVASDADRPLTALFVGSLGIRKGIHLALEAWRAAGIAGKFVLLGRVEPGFRPILERYLEPGRIEHRDFDPSPQRLFQEADFFLFPTLEEGAPLVCYEACGSGLPVVTSRAGTARIIEDGANGIVVDPHDAAALRGAIEQMADGGLRQRMAANARASALRFTWAEAARQRLACFETAVSAGY